MYKIYVNDHPLILVSTTDMENLKVENALVLPYMGDPKMLIACLDKLEKTQNPISIIIHSENFASLKRDFRGLFKKIKAAGGVLFDENNRVLFIFRLHRWDLPKGKVDKKEHWHQAALREVEEETGLPCILEHKVATTRHTYRLSNGKRVLKTTKWYKMKPNHTRIKLQYSEFIEDAKWIEPLTFMNSDLPTYASIKDAVNSTIENKNHPN